jgi:hypothetical protein
MLLKLVPLVLLLQVRGVCCQKAHAPRVGPLLQLGEQLFEAQLKWATQNPRNYLIDQSRCNTHGSALQAVLQTFKPFTITPAPVLRLVDNRV